MCMYPHLNKPCLLESVRSCFEELLIYLSFSVTLLDSALNIKTIPFYTHKINHVPFAV